MSKSYNHAFERSLEEAEENEFEEECEHAEEEIGAERAEREYTGAEQAVYDGEYERRIAQGYPPAGAALLAKNAVVGYRVENDADDDEGWVDDNEEWLEGEEEGNSDQEAP